MRGAGPLLCLLLALGAVPPSARAETTLIARNATWKYLATPTAAASAWRDSGFSDAAWPSGPGFLGFGEAYISTLVPYGPDANNKYITTYFRRTFTRAAGVSPTSMRLEANYDDGFMAYLNGIEIARRGIAAGPVNYGTLAASHEGGAYEIVDVSASSGLLRVGSNLLAIEVHQVGPTSSDLVWDGALVIADAPSITRGPYLQVGTPHSVMVRWRTDVPASSLIRFGSSIGSLVDSVFDSTPTTEHEVTVPGLQPAQRYYYAAGTAETLLVGGDLTHFFETPPLPGTARATRAWIVGDAGWGSLAQMQVRDAYQAFTGSRHTSLWLMLGDNAYSAGTDGEYQTGLFDVYGAMLGKSVLWSTRGNHDQIYAGPANDYYDIFTLPTAAEAGGIASGTEAYYSFDWANIHFICLDSEGTDRSVGGAMASWLRQDLAATDATWIVAFWHHPPYTKGSHDSDNALDSGGRMQDMRQNVLPILDSTGVDLVLTGHSHSYERSFLLNGHYGLSPTLTPAMIVDGRDGRIGGDGAYAKPTAGQGPFEGSVYTVAGSAGTTSGGTLNHPVMISSLNVLGSLVLDMEGARLDGHFVTNTGAVLDSFTIFKGGALAVDSPAAPPATPALSLAGLNPVPAGAGARLRFALPRSGRARVTVLDPAGRQVATLLDGALEAGTHDTVWSGTDSRRQRVSPGIYFAVLEADGQRRAVKLVLER